MRKLIVAAVFISLCVLVSCAPAGAAQMRGLWVDAFHPGFKSPAETSALVQKARECNFNALFVQVRKRGDVYYRSTIEPMAVDVMPGYDPLADVITKAHAAGLEVHAWVSTYEVYHESKWTKSRSQVHLTHKEWLTADPNGNTRLPDDKLFLDPGLPEVQDYIVGIATEIASNYSVDGIQLEAARYPLTESGYNETALARFSKETGRTDKPKPDDKQWSDWRRDQVTSLIRKSYAAITRANQRVRVSAAVYGGVVGAQQLALQDWPRWIKEGILDAAVPMIFADDDRVFAQMVQTCLSAAGGKRHVYIGHAGWKMDSKKSLDRLDTTRVVGAPGTVVYSYWYCSQPIGRDASRLMGDLKAGAYSRPDTVPVMAWKQ